MLKNFKKINLINSIIILITIILAIMSINWHYKMFQMHTIETKINAEIEIATAINKQLLMDYSEILSGINIIYKSEKILMMKYPNKEKKMLSL